VAAVVVAVAAVAAVEGAGKGRTRARDSTLDCTSSWNTVEEADPTLKSRRPYDNSL